MLPFYMTATKSYGINPNELGLMTITELKPYADAYWFEERKKMESLDYQYWLAGIYTLNAINSSLVGNSQIVSGKHKPIEYPREAMFTKEENKKEISAEVSEQFAVTKMKCMIANWDLPEAPM